MVVLTVSQTFYIQGQMIGICGSGLDWPRSQTSQDSHKTSPVTEAHWVQFPLASESDRKRAANDRMTQGEWLVFLKHTYIHTYPHWCVFVFLDRSHVCQTLLINFQLMWCKLSCLPNSCLDISNPIWTGFIFHWAPVYVAGYTTADWIKAFNTVPWNLVYLK